MDLTVDSHLENTHWAVSTGLDPGMAKGLGPRCLAGHPLQRKGVPFGQKDQLRAMQSSR